MQSHPAHRCALRHARRFRLRHRYCRAARTSQDADTRGPEGTAEVNRSPIARVPCGPVPPPSPRRESVDQYSPRGIRISRAEPPRNSLPYSPDGRVSVAAPTSRTIARCAGAASLLLGRPLRKTRPTTMTSVVPRIPPILWAANPDQMELSYRGKEAAQPTACGPPAARTPAAGFGGAPSLAWQELEGRRVPVEVGYPPVDPGVSRTAPNQRHTSHEDPGVVPQRGRRPCPALPALRHEADRVPQDRWLEVHPSGPAGLPRLGG